MDEHNSALPFADATLGFGLTGEVTLSDAERGMRYFRQLLDALVAEVAPDAGITWIIKEASASSYAAATIPVSDNADAVDSVRAAFAQTAQAMESGHAIPYLRAVQPARRMVRLAKGHTELQLEDNGQLIASIGDPRPPRVAESHWLESRGSIRGYLRVLSDERGFRVWIRDDATGARVPVNLTEHQIDEASGFFRQHVIVQGIVRRSALSGMPTLVRNVSDLRSEPIGAAGDWEKAIGAVQPDSDLSPEDAIRRGRDD